MRPTPSRISLSFAAGALGGLANSLAVWLSGTLGISAALGVRLAPELTPLWLYPRIVWGGIWGLLLLLPGLRGKPWLRGFVLSLAPSLVMLLVIFPRMGQGIGGTGQGTLMPLLVLLFNAVWGWGAVFWLRASGGR